MTITTKETNMTFYFAHAASDYGTEFEAEVLAWLALNDIAIENPNQPHHQEGYAAKGMDYFTQDVLPGCDGCVFMAMPGYSLGAGVALEIQHFLDAGQKVLEIRIRIDANGVFYLAVVSSLEAFTVLSRDETRKLVKTLKALPNGGRA